MYYYLTSNIDFILCVLVYIPIYYLFYMILIYFIYNLFMGFVSLEKKIGEKICITKIVLKR